MTSLLVFKGPEAFIDWTVWKKRSILNARIAKALNRTVCRGPFTGLKLSEDIFWGGTDVASQLLGIYEQEVLHEVQASESRTLLYDFGSADGYYAIGWCKSRSDRTCVAFELSNEGQIATRRNAIVNGVEARIEVNGELTRESLLSIEFPSSVSCENVLVISDIEGAEYELFSREVLRRFKGCKWIIEVHEFDHEMRKKLVSLQLLAEEFYKVRLLVSGPRNPHSLSELESLSDVERWLLCAEGRDGLPGKWLVLY